MLREIVLRLGNVPVALESEWRCLSDGTPLARRLTFPLEGMSRGNVQGSVRATFIAGMPGEVLWGRLPTG